MMSESNSRFQFLIDKTAKRINMVIGIKSRNSAIIM